MGAFFLARKHRTRDATARSERVLSELRRQGFTSPKVLDTPEFEIWVYPKQIAPERNYVEFPDGGFCAGVGTFLYHGESGVPALSRAYEDFSPARWGGRFEQSLGNYCLILYKAGSISLVLDPLGIYKVFRADDAEVFSSSFLATLAALERPRVDTQGIYEYLFQGATYGNATVIKQIRLLDPGEGPGVDRDRQRRSVGARSAASWFQSASTTDLSDQLAVLRRQYAVIADCYGNRIDTALSGGYDSRLTLALLLEQGVRPRVHVYGRPSDADVQVAKEIDAGMGLGLLHVDKSDRPRPDPDEFGEIVNRNLMAFDGLPSDGVFGSGADLETRVSRCADGYLALNGGGGEIYRNFFYLADRPYRITELLWAFYSRFDPRDCTAVFSEDTYYRNLAEKVRRTLDTEGDRLTRRQVELVYPLFRCRYWMGRNNSLNNRFGPALTPFIELDTVGCAAGIPMERKYYGAIEGEMIRAVNPNLAGYPSGYGHGFDGPPPFRRRIRERLVYVRPPLLRRYSYRVKNRIRKSERPLLLSPDYLEPIVGADFPYLSRFVRVASIRDWEQFNRICTLELVLQRYGVSET